MFTYAKRNALLAVLAVSLLVAPATAQAFYRNHDYKDFDYRRYDYNRYKDYKKPDVDLESVKATLHRASQGWYLNIRYEIELEDTHPDRFDVLISFSERGYMLMDARGRPIELFEGLGRPTEIDDDEFEFKNRVLVTLPRYIVHNPHKLKTHVAVIDRYTNRIIENKSTSVKWKR
jgi:hypothetical protein